MTFAGDALFREVTFAGRTVFDGVGFTKDAKFDRMRVAQSSLDVTLDELAKLGGNTGLRIPDMALAGGQGPPHSLDINLPSG